MPRRKKQVQDKFPYSATDIIRLEDIYTVIHFVQTSRKECTFLAHLEESVIMENLFRDSEIKFACTQQKNAVKYSLTPPPIRAIPDEAFMIDEEYPDEILEDGQCF